ncbi:MAG: S8 family serine peptidase [ANME-2 cluster archaeon]|nr:S8 family serine peptidase [ANME-2 cluster archaeon]
MKIKQKISTLICIAIILCIFIPSVMGVKNTTVNEFEKSRYSIFTYHRFDNSIINSELLDKIEKGKDNEIDVIITMEKKGFTTNTVTINQIETNEFISNVQSSLKNIEAKNIMHYKLTNAFSATVNAKNIEGLAAIENIGQISLDYNVHALLDESIPIIEANSVWSEYDGSGIIVAVVDTGIDSNHPDLKNKIIDQVSFVQGEPSPNDGLGHGTHVAGIIAGNGVASGGKYKGVAPGASLINIKVLDEYGYGTASSVMSGIEYAVEHGADVISLSLGGYYWPSDGSDPLAMTANAAVDQGVVVIVAAGNDGCPFCISTPASAEKVIAVGATTKQDDIAMYSSMGPTWDHRIKPEVVAPGGASYIYEDPAGLGIVSAKATDSIFEEWYTEYIVDKYYLSLSGTSMATPHVSGVAALMLQAHPDWTPDKIKQQLMNTAVDVGYGPITQGAGRINALSAVENTLNVEPISLSYIAMPGEYSNEIIEISNTGTENITVDLYVSGDIEGNFSTDTIYIGPRQTVEVNTVIGMPAGISTGMHYGGVTIYEGDTSISVPVLIDAPMTFVNGRSRFSDVIDLKTSEWYGQGTSYYYFEIPEDCPGLTSTMICPQIDGYIDLYLLDPDGEFIDMDYCYYDETEATVSVIDPMPGRWMLLVNSWIFEPEVEYVHLTLTTQFNSLEIEPAYWMVPSIIPTNTSVDKNFTVTNMDNNPISVQVEGYISVPDIAASGRFNGSVDYINFYPEPPGPTEPMKLIRLDQEGEEELWNERHIFDITDDASEFTLTMVALNDTAVLAADIYDPNGKYIDWLIFGLWEPSTDSITIMDPMSGTWTVEVFALYAENNTTEHYTGVYDVKSKDTSWIVNNPESLFIPAMSQTEFTSILTPTDEANGDYTGELTVSCGDEIIDIPISVSVGKNVPYPGNFTDGIRNKAYGYYSMDVNSDKFVVNITWDNMNNDLDLFLFDPSGTIVASSTQSDSVYETVEVADSDAGMWTVGVFGYCVDGTQQFTGIVG